MIFLEKDFNDKSAQSPVRFVHSMSGTLESSKTVVGRYTTYNTQTYQTKHISIFTQE